jgi:purine-binding chemotaxis protein CheW
MQVATRGSVRLGLMTTGGITVGIDVSCVAEVCRVRGVSPIFASAPGLLGAIDLRGEPIPLFDPRALAGLGQSDTSPDLAVIASGDGRRIALGFDTVEGLTEVGVDQLKAVRGVDGSAFAGTLEDRGRIVSLLEPRALLARQDIPSASAAAASETRGAIGATSHLTVESGSARFAIVATAIEATVPRQKIEPHSLANGAWLGIIGHHGRRVPVMHLNAVLGMGEIRDLGTAEIVILRLPGDKLIGFAVEMIRRMELVPRTGETPLPALLAGRTAAIRAVLQDGAEGDTFLVDVGALAGDEALLGIAGLSAEPAAPSSPEPGADAAAEGARPERERYLVARAGAPIAIPICQVARIAKLPDRVTALPRAPAWVRGVFREAGVPGPLVDLRHRLGYPPTEVTERSRVLIAGSASEPIGFVVEGVDHLEWSDWRSDGRAEGMITGVVSLPRLGARSVMPLVDLTCLEPTLAGPAMAERG